MRAGLALHAAIALGGALGALARHLLSLAVLSLAGAGFPWGTLAANVAGSFLIGLLARRADRGAGLAARPRVRAFAQIGFCGGFTTLSAFSLETLLLVQAGTPRLAALYVAASPPLWLAAAALGWRLGGPRPETPVDNF